jgi:alkylation response protein AidB-like acyl-CoA dehydrogenase
MTSSVFKAMQVMGVNSLDRKHPIERYMRESMVFPLYDAGNLGMQVAAFSESCGRRLKPEPALNYSA